MGMRTVLRNRMCQVHMLIFRPFVAAALAQSIARGQTGPRQERRTALPPALLQGALEALGYATSFLLEQPPAVSRHYGSRLLAPNTWAAGLLCVAAAHLPDGAAFSPSGGPSGPAAAEVTEAVGRAHSILWQ